MEFLIKVLATKFSVSYQKIDRWSKCHKTPPLFLNTVIHIYIHTYTHTHIHTYTHTHIHTYIYTHIHSLFSIPFPNSIMKYFVEPISENPKYPCGTCKLNVNKTHKAIQCDNCNYWNHINVIKLIVIHVKPLKILKNTISVTCVKKKYFHFINYQINIFL